MIQLRLKSYKNL